MCRRSLLLTLSMLAASSAALAGAELTPSVGVRTGGSVATDGGSTTLDASPVFGLTLDVPLAPEKWIAVLWSHQNADFSAAELLDGVGDFALDIDYIQAAGVYRPGPDKKTQPFVMAGAGLTWIRPQPSGFGDEFGLSGMIGGGAKFRISPRIGLRVEGRGYLTFTNITLSGVCGGVGCSVRFESGGILQFEALGGITFSF